MSLRIKRSPEARADALRNAIYIAEDSSLTQGERFLAALNAQYRSLARMPGLGTERRYGNSHYRMWSVPGFRKYLIFYTYTKTALEIIRVLHGARDLPDILSEPQE